MSGGTTSSDNEVVPPLNLMFILQQESGEDLFKLSVPDLHTRLRTGLILRDKENTETRFFWMDEKSKNCFMLLPKSLRISTDSGQAPRYVSETEKRCTGKEIILPRSKYERVGYFKVEGKFGMIGLTTGVGTEYVVVLLVQLTPTGFKSASTKRLSLPDGSQTRQPWQWVDSTTTTPGEYQIGTFLLPTKTVGELSFDIQVFFRGRPDILIKGVAIKPPSAKS